LDAALMNEAVDETWSYDAEMRLESTLTGALADLDWDARLHSVTCGATFCRANVVSERGDAYGSVYSAIMSGGFSWTGSGGTLVRSDDNTQTHLYVTRTGHSLPPVTNPVPDSSI